MPNVTPTSASFVLVVFIFSFLGRTMAGIYLLERNGAYLQGVYTLGTSR
jgi:hypothetical protein